MFDSLIEFITVLFIFIIPGSTGKVGNLLGNILWGILVIFFVGICVFTIGYTFFEKFFK